MQDVLQEESRIDTFNYKNQNNENNYSPQKSLFWPKTDNFLSPKMLIFVLCTCCQSEIVLK